MARPTPDHLTTLIADIEAEPSAWEFFALVRAIEQASPQAPRIGQTLDPADESIELAHQPSLDFPRTTVAGFDRETRRPRVRSQHLGLTGPMGPLPLHMAEIAIVEQSTLGPKPFGDFLDMISARMLQGFYRAWASGEPCAQADRPPDDRFASFIGAVSGGPSLRFVTGAERGALDEPGFGDWRRLAYGGHFAGLRSAAAVGDMLGHVLERPVAMVEAVGRWRAIPQDARTRIGARGSYQQLGRGATVGARFYAVEWNVAFNVRASSMADLERLLPGGEAHALLVEAAAAMLPAHLDWEARIEIDERDVQPARLGAMRLGMTGWVAPQGRNLVRGDVRIAGSKARAPLAA